MRVLITGDRAWKKPELIRQELERLKKAHGLNLFVVTGGNGETDITATKVCMELGIDHCIFPPNWKGRGKPGGPFRNGLMLRIIKPQLVIAFHNFLPASKGTKDCVEQARKLGIGCYVVTGDELEDLSPEPSAEQMELSSP